VGPSSLAVSTPTFHSGRPAEQRDELPPLH
jgi:hypothetical protein